MMEAMHSFMASAKALAGLGTGEQGASSKQACAGQVWGQGANSPPKRQGSSVNDCLEEGTCSVCYASFDEAIDLVRAAGKGALMAKADIEFAFRLLPVHPSIFHLLGDGGDDTVQGGVVAFGTVEQRIGALGEPSLAPATRAKYNTCFDRFTSVTQSWGAGEAHPPATGVHRFVLWAKDNGKSHTWVSRHLASIAHFSKLRGDGDPTAGFPLKAALKGWARQEGKTPNQRAPIDLDMLRALVGALTAICNTQYVVRCHIFPSLLRSVQDLRVSREVEERHVR
ncbi:hypothetical protein NDU88_003975 [Pleurodeles waltl]|uniref:Uncharacterized protein n=1 Tax=Pleurodeles waltl TaxID=8319 RepID=A0AAV7W7P3_PLEWA|nr:hypothetical protein NDU88_003975 [Pleurodeles waltl]